MQKTKTLTFRRRLLLLGLFASTALICATALADYGPWQALKDGADNAIDWRTSKGNFQYDGDTYKYSYQFRNRYTKTVEFKAVVAYEDDKGVERTESLPWKIVPQGTDGTSIICRRLKSVRITTPKVAQ